MKLLLDTQIALFAITDDDRLSAKARGLIDDPENEIVVSAASVWEISIKHALARGVMPISGREALGFFKDAGFELLGISPTHTVAIEALAPLHADPFGRMLVAQALSTPLRLLTRDQRIAAYSDLVILV
jgi:PIN domain nuclease of toxin-antitoxin system